MPTPHTMPVPDPSTPDWGNNRMANDWRDFITEELQAMWETFTPAQKMAIASNAQWLADRE
jgi:hypothetical protein